MKMLEVLVYQCAAQEKYLSIQGYQGLILYKLYLPQILFDSVLIADKYKGLRLHVADGLFYQVWLVKDAVSVEVDHLVCRTEMIGGFDAV